jgi:hypothetical protein
VRDGAAILPEQIEELVLAEARREIKSARDRRLSPLRGVE